MKVRTEVINAPRIYPASSQHWQATTGITLNNRADVAVVVDSSTSLLRLANSPWHWWHPVRSAPWPCTSTPIITGIRYSREQQSIASLWRNRREDCLSFATTTTLRVIE